MKEKMPKMEKDLIDSWNLQSSRTPFTITNAEFLPVNAVEGVVNFDNFIPCVSG